MSSNQKDGKKKIASPEEKEKKTLTERVYEWLDKEGYPLEMMVSREFRQSGFRVTQGKTYNDPNTGQSRECDILATAMRSIDGRLIKTIYVIQCKTSTDKPWIGFTDPSLAIKSSDRLARVVASPHGRKLLEGFASDSHFQNKGLFREFKQYTYSMTTAMKADGKDTAYHAAASVMAATGAITALLHKSPYAAILFPVIILEGNLFSSYLTMENCLGLDQVERTDLLWNNPSPNHPDTLIHVSTKAHLHKFIEECKQTNEAVFSLDANKVGSVLGRPTGDVRADHHTLDF